MTFSNCVNNAKFLVGIMHILCRVAKKSSQSNVTFFLIISNISIYVEKNNLDPNQPLPSMTLNFGRLLGMDMASKRFF